MEVRQILVTALGRDYDVSPMLPELRRMAEAQARQLKRGKAMLKKLQRAEAKASATAAAVELIEMVKGLQSSELSRLVGFAGLPVGDDEQVDAKAAAARARGDLFFEDTSGDAPLENLLSGGSSTAEEAMLQVQKRKLGNLDGVEQLRQ